MAEVFANSEDPDQMPHSAVSDPKEIICMKCQNMFSGKIKKKYFSMSSAENFTQSAKC